jgi:glycosyltransferase involved in cell wall biosynthesis
VSSLDIYTYPSGGVNLNQFRPFGKQTLRKAYNINSSFVIGFVGRIDQGKRWDIFLNMLRLLIDKNPLMTIKGVVVGTGLELEGFHRHIKQNSLESTIIFLGERDHSELPQIYNLMDVFVFATDNESLGLVGLESMACGVPIIAPLVGGIGSYLEDMKNGLVLDSLDEIKLLAKVEMFIALSPMERAQLSANAVTTAKAFDAMGVTKNLASKLQSLVTVAI